MSAVVDPVISVDDRALALRLLAEAGCTHPYPLLTLQAFDGIVAKACLHGGRRAVAQAFDYRSCRVCGCTEITACHPEPCSWVEADLCSTCAPFAERAAEIGA